MPVNELEVVSTPVFVAPHYIEELRCDGLTAAEIAKSLTTDVDLVRRKLRERGEYDALLGLGLKLSIGRIYNNNGVEFEEFYLSTEAAKLFVARYQIDVRDGFLKSLVVDSESLRRISAKVAVSGLTQSELDHVVIHGKRLIALEQRYLGSIEDAKHKAERDRRSQAEHTPISDEEYALLQRLMASRLKVFGRLKPKHRRDFYNELLDKFCYSHPEMEDCFFKLPRKNWEAALNYVKTRKWSPLDR